MSWTQAVDWTKIGTSNILGVLLLTHVNHFAVQNF